MSNAKLADIVTRKLVMVNCNSSVQQVAEIMAARHVSAVVLADNDRPVGILTERDLARQVCAKGLVAGKTPATALMSAPVVTVGSDSTMESAAELMLKSGIRHLVVEDEKHRPLGMITATDFAWFLGRKAFGESSILDLLYPYEEMGEEMP